MDIESIKSVLTGEFAYIFTLTSLIFLAISFYTSYKYRDDLLIEIVPESNEHSQSFKGLTTLVQAHIKLVSQTHRESREAASDLNIFRDLAMPPQGEAIAISDQLEKLIRRELKAPVKLLTLIFKWLFRPPKVEGKIFSSNLEKKNGKTSGEVTITCRYIPKRKRGDVTQIDTIRRSGEVDIDGMAKECALKIVHLLSSSVGTKSWDALGLVTEALKHWPPTATIKSKSQDTAFEESEKKLRQALKIDSKSPLVNYNLALILYYEYGGKQNIQAIKHFERSWQTDIQRHHYLGKIGLARCYCQNYHRFGKQTHNDLLKARDAAHEAVELIKKEKQRLGYKYWSGYLRIEYARALYCRAFAQHLTQKDDDIEKGKKDYLDIIKLYCPSFEKQMAHLPNDIDAGIEILREELPKVPAVVYNNLGYIIMVRGGRFVPRDEKSRKFYDEAKKFMELALRREADYKFAHANMGNLERLRKDYDEAIKHYKIAIEQDPKYVNGYSRLAWVYLETNEPQKAREAYEEALKLADLDSHKSKVKEYFARSHWNIGKIEEAKKLISEAIQLDKKTENLELLDWISHEEELKGLQEKV